MTKARYQKVITITEEENKKIEELQAKKIKVVEIFRKGLDLLYSKIK